MSTYAFKKDSFGGLTPVIVVPSASTQNAVAPNANPMNDDREWNRTMFSDEKARILFQMFERMRGCINRCIFSRYGSVNEMLISYKLVYEEVNNIITKNMRDTNYPPSVFSAAVHQHVMHNNLNKDPTWRVLSGVFEYTAMEIAAEIEARRVKDKPDANEAANDAANDAEKTISWWLWHKTGDSKHPQDVMRETHEKVHASHDKLVELDNKLQIILNQIQNMQKNS